MKILAGVYAESKRKESKRVRKTLFLIFLFSHSLTLLLSASILFAGNVPHLEEKIKMRLIVREVQGIARVSKSLDELGQKTIEQSKEILDIGSAAAYMLPYYLNDPDWKVRFWIVDILGYLGNPDAQRPLVRVYRNKNEDARIRSHALKSLRKIGK